MNEQDLLLSGITKVAIAVSAWSGKDDVEELKGILKDVQSICLETVEDVGKALDKRSRRLFMKVPAKKC